VGIACCARYVQRNKDEESIMLRRSLACLALTAALAAASRPAGAEEAVLPVGPAAADVEPPSPDRTTEIDRLPLHVAAIAGIGFPRPFAVEVMGSWADVVTIGAEYGFLPTVTVDGVETDLWSLAGDFRIRPFRSAFFVGALAGRQHVAASTSISVSGIGSANEQLEYDSWFVNPRIGFLWTMDHGLAVGLDAGVQIPIGPTVSSSLPLALYPAAQARVDSIGGAVLPTIDLLRIGLQF
jgi:hypothetical protein